MIDIGCREILDITCKALQSLHFDLQWYVWHFRPKPHTNWYFFEDKTSWFTLSHPKIFQPKLKSFLFTVMIMLHKYSELCPLMKISDISWWQREFFLVLAIFKAPPLWDRVPVGKSWSGWSLHLFGSENISEKFWIETMAYNRLLWMSHCIVWRCFQ